MERDRRTLPGIPPGSTSFLRALVLCTAAAVLFVLPFAHRPTQQVFSVSYAAGADNRLATIGLAGLAVLTLLLEWRVGLSLPFSRSEEGREAANHNGWIPAITVWGGVAAVTVFTLVLGYLIQRSGLRYGDVSYFIERIRDLADYHLQLYRDVEFTYGPLLILPAVWLHRVLGPLHVSESASYFLSLAAMNAAGVAMVAWLLNRLPLTGRSRTLLFSLCVLVQLHPLLGINYSFVKFAIAPFLIVWSTRRQGALTGALAFLITNLAVLLISPELEVGTAAATFVYALLMLKRLRWRAVLLLFMPPVAIAFFLSMFGRGFIDRLAHASAGAMNLIPEPMPHLLILGVAAAWLAPLVTGYRLRERSTDSSLLACLFVLALGMLPGALGRCDPLHVFFNGLTMLFLATMAMEKTRGSRLWAATLIVLALDVQVVNYRLFSDNLLALLRPPSVRPAIDIAELRTATGGNARIATPDLTSVPLPVELQLRRAGFFQPDYYPGLVEIWDEAGERRKVNALHASEWMLGPASFFATPDPLPNDTVKRIFRFGYRYRQRQTPYIVGTLLNHEVQTNWTPVRTFGNLTLYRRVRDLQP